MIQALGTAESEWIIRMIALALDVNEHDLREVIDSRLEPGRYPDGREWVRHRMEGRCQWFLSNGSRCSAQGDHDPYLPTLCPRHRGKFEMEAAHWVRSKVSTDPRAARDMARLVAEAVRDRWSDDGGPTWQSVCEEVRTVFEASDKATTMAALKDLWKETV